MDRHVFNYRCSKCHRIIEREHLLSGACPMCGWEPPFLKPLDVGEDMEITMVDVFDEGKHVVVLAEVPGFAESEIEVRALNYLLIITAHGLAGTCRKWVMLPSSTVGKPHTRYNNGVLEITLRKGLHGR